MQACIDLGGSSIKVAVAEAGKLTSVTTVPGRTDAVDLARAANYVRDMASGAPIDAVAIAVPGLVSADGRSLREAHKKYAWLLGSDLAGWSEDEFGAPAQLANDARAALLGEVTSGCAAGSRDAVILVLGTGIGTAAMIGGVILSGPHGSAGVLGGHVTVDRNGPICNCGNIGCAEVYGSSWGLAMRATALRSGGIVGSVEVADGFASVTQGAREGDALATALLNDAINAWGACAVSMCHAFDPDTIILTGGVAHAADLVTGPFARYLDEHVWGALPRPRVVVARDPAHSVVRGLVALATEMKP